MKLRTIACGRTYNTGNFTSQRFDFTAELEPNEDYELALRALAELLHEAALSALREQGLTGITEPGGYLPLKKAPAASVTGEGDVDEIPF